MTDFEHVCHLIRCRPRWWLLWSPRAWEMAHYIEGLANRALGRKISAAVGGEWIEYRQRIYYPERRAKKGGKA